MLPIVSSLSKQTVDFSLRLSVSMAHPFLGLGSRKENVATYHLVSWLLSLLLIVNPAFVSAATAADYYVRSLPGAPEGPLLKMHAG